MNNLRINNLDDILALEDDSLNSYLNFQVLF
jgi:hypothetical protein